MTAKKAAPKAKQYRVVNYEIAWPAPKDGEERRAKRDDIVSSNELPDRYAQILLAGGDIEEIS